MASKIIRELNRYIAALPERQRRMRARHHDLCEEYFEFRIKPPEPIPDVIQTLDPKVSRVISPQLKDWYSKVGAVVEGSWKYLSPSMIKSTVKLAKVKEIVASHREYWDDSAPMIFSDSSLSVFSLIGDISDGDLIYLVWPQEDSTEPELWEYFWQSQTRYKDLCAYVTALMEK